MSHAGANVIMEAYGRATARRPWSSWLPPRDPRTKDWMFIGNLPFILTLVFGYIYLVKVAGPRWMATREPFRIKPLVQLYNLAMVLLNLYFTTQFLRYSYLGGEYSLLCQGMTHSTDNNSLRLVELCYWYFWVRVGDYLDTFFFLLRKKFSHISTLHYTHHALCVWSGWLWLTYGCDGQTMLGLIVNSCVHVVMYTYYFLAAFGPQMRPYLWWKRYITTVQIAQFVVLMVHFFVPLVVECGYPKGMIYLACSMGAIGLVQFINFYIAAYVVSKRKLESRVDVASQLIGADVVRRTPDKIAFGGEMRVTEQSEHEGQRISATGEKHWRAPTERDAAGSPMKLVSAITSNNVEKEKSI